MFLYVTMYHIRIRDNELFFSTLTYIVLLCIHDKVLCVCTCVCVYVHVCVRRYNQHRVRNAAKSSFWCMPHRLLKTWNIQHVWGAKSCTNPMCLLSTCVFMFFCVRMVYMREKHHKNVLQWDVGKHVICLVLSNDKKHTKYLSYCWVALTVV